MKGPRLIGTRNINRNRHTSSYDVWDFVQIIVDIIGMGLILASFGLILYNLCIPWKPDNARFLPCDPSPCGEAACVAHKNNSFTCVPEPNYKFLKDKGWTVPMCETDQDCDTGDGFVCHDGGCECPPHLTHVDGICIRVNCEQKLLQASCIRPDKYRAISIFARLAQLGIAVIPECVKEDISPKKSSLRYQGEVETRSNCISGNLSKNTNKTYFDEILKCSADCAVWVGRAQAFEDAGNRDWNIFGEALSNGSGLPDVLSRNELLGALTAIRYYESISMKECTASMQLVKFECGTRVLNKLMGSSTVKNETMPFARGFWSALMLSTGSRECKDTPTVDIVDRFLHYCYQVG